MSTSLEAWRTHGWKAAGHRYRIRGYALVDFHDPDQIRTGQIWDVTTGPGAEPGSWGGHYVYLVGYTPAGPVCVTWGRKQQMTWPWLAAYCDEAYAIFDARNRFRKNVIDKGKLDRALQVFDTVSA